MRAAAEVQPGQRHIKRVIAELGGKNCVIVDADADLDDAVPGIVSSAFLYAGQKCSAAARVLVHEAIADRLIERVAGATSVLVVGQAADSGHRGPAGDRAGGPGAGAAGTSRWGLVRAGSSPGLTRAGPGWFCPPTVIADLPADSPVLRDEIFGPCWRRAGQ